MKDLKELIKICRANGVESVEYQGIKLTFGSLPIKERRSKSQPRVNIEEVSFDPGQIPVSQVVQETIESDEMTPEDLLFYSSEGTSNEAV